MVGEAVIIAYHVVKVYVFVNVVSFVWGTCRVAQARTNYSSVVRGNHIIISYLMLSIIGESTQLLPCFFLLVRWSGIQNWITEISYPL